MKKAVLKVFSIVLVLVLVCFVSIFSGCENTPELTTTEIPTATSDATFTNEPDVTATKEPSETPKTSPTENPSEKPTPSQSTAPSPSPTKSPTPTPPVWKPNAPVDLSDLRINDKNTTVIALTSDWHADHKREKASRDILQKALNAFYTVAPNLDAFCIVGDVVNGGYTTDINNYLPAQYTVAKRYLNQYLKPETQRILMMGNHEWAYMDGVSNVSSAQKQEITGFFERGLNTAIGNASYRPDALGITSSNSSHVTTTIVNGIVVFGVSPEVSTGGYRNAEAYLRVAIPEAAKQYPGKPILLLNHAPIQDTVISTRNNNLNPGSGASDALNFDNASVCANWSNSFLSFLENYPQLFYVSGHTHDSIREPLAIHQKNFTCVNDGVLDSEYSSGLLFTYNAETRRVVIYRMNVGAGRFYSEPWVVELEAGKAGFRYTDKRITESASPVFPNGANLKITQLAKNKLTVTYNKGQVENRNDDGYVQSYVFRIKDKETGKYLYISIWGEVKPNYYRDYIEYDALPMEDDCKTIIEDISLKSGRSYTLEMFAWTPFYAQSQTYSLDFICP